MKRTILILMLSAALSAQAQFTEFFCNITGTNVNTNVFLSGQVNYSVNPWVDQPSDNFTLNTTAGGGALAINAARSHFLRSPTVSYPDIGSAQVTNSASGSVTVVAYPLSFRR